MFEPHGEFHASIDEHLLILNVRGPWNMELIQKYGKDIQPLVEKLALQGPWCSIVIARGDCSFTPDAIDLLRRISDRHVRQLKRQATAYVVPLDTKGRAMIDNSVNAIYRDSQPARVFETRQEAMAWLQSICPEMS